MSFKPPKIHTIQIKVDDQTYKAITKKKGKKPWTEFIYDLAKE